MSKVPKNTPSLIGRYRSLGVTFYRRGDTVIARTSTKEQPSHQTPAQFRSRERVRRLISLWISFPGESRPFMDSPDGLIPYRAFLRINTALPTPFLTREQNKNGGAVLVPDICVSAGRIDPIEYSFETLPDGRRFLVTNIRTNYHAAFTQPIAADDSEDLGSRLAGKDQNPSLRNRDVLRFYCLEQIVRHTETDDVPLIKVLCNDIPLHGGKHRGTLPSGHELYTHRGFLAVAGVNPDSAAYAVVVIDPRNHTASTQQAITTSTFHEAYLTDEAFARATESYGNVRDSFLTPEVDQR